LFVEWKVYWAFFRDSIKVDESESEVNEELRSGRKTCNQLIVINCY
jgi:hypothetical protein